jgi:hypothetical protein
MIACDFPPVRPGIIKAQIRSEIQALGVFPAMRKRPLRDGQEPIAGKSVLFFK